MGTMGYGGWQYYGGASPFASGASSFADNFMKAYSLFKGLNLKEEEAERQKEIQGEQLKKLKEEAERTQKGKEYFEKLFRPQVINPPVSGSMPVPSTQPQAPGMPPLTGTPAQALTGPSIAQARFGLMPGQAPGGPVQAPPQGPQVGPLEKNVMRPQPTLDQITQGIMLYGSPEQKADMVKSIITARSREASLENALEKQELRNKGYMDVAQAKIDAALQQIYAKGAMGAYGGAGQENKDNKLAAAILQGQAGNLQSEISNIERAIENARPKDRAALQARREALQGQLDMTRNQINSLLGDVKPKVAAKKDAPKNVNYTATLEDARKFAEQGKPIEEIKKRLRTLGYTDKQFDTDPYFVWMRK